MIEKLEDLKKEKILNRAQFEQFITDRTQILQTNDPIIQNWIGSIKEINIFIKQIENLIKE